MKNEFLILSIIILTMSTFFPVDILSKTKKIKMMYFDVPPFVIFDEKTKKISGATYDLIENYIAKELDVKFVWDKAPSTVPRQLSILKKSSDCAAALLIYSEERANFVSFTSLPYIYTNGFIAVLQSNKLNKISKVEDMLDLTIGYGLGVYLDLFMRDKRLKLDLVSNANFIEICLLKMINNRIDAVYCPNNYQMLYLIQKNNLKNKVKLIPIPGIKSPHYVVFAKNMGDIVNRYNQILTKLDVKNLYIRLLKKYIDIPDI